LDIRDPGIPFLREATRCILSKEFFIFKAPRERRGRRGEVEKDEDQEGRKEEREKSKSKRKRKRKGGGRREE
jgi:hypothetical protein